MSIPSPFFERDPPGDLRPQVLGVLDLSRRHGAVVSNGDEPCLVRAKRENIESIDRLSRSGDSRRETPDLPAFALEELDRARLGAIEGR